MSQSDLHKTPLHAMHLEAGARMVPFAGYEMPVQFAAGVLKEHLHTREAAGLFDVSHMGQVEIRPKDGRPETAAAALETLVPSSVLGLKPGRQRYSLLTDDKGGILDDLMIAHCGDHFFLVVNAACKSGDIAHLGKHLAGSCDVVERDDRALLALQGPQAEAVLTRLAPEAGQMRFMDVRTLSIAGSACTVSRSGYTGEDGFEISVPAEEAEALAERLLENDTVRWIGLGARDSLRLEAGLCLYGHDLTPETTPVEAALEWAVQKVRRRDGEREGGFPGAARILDQMDNGASRRRVGLRAEGRAPVREGTDLYASDSDGPAIGKVTSGSFGPSVGGPVAMGYVPSEAATVGTRLFAEVRGKRIPVQVAALPFTEQRYKR